MSRKKVLMLLFCISCSIHAIAQANYYYYKGNKIPLSLNENKVVVCIPKECNETDIKIRANVHTLNMISDEAFDICVITQSDYEKLTSLDFWEEDAKSVIITSCYFTESNEEVFTSPYLTVKLKKEQDIDLLTSYAEKYRLKILKQDPFLPLWYILNVTPDSDKNPLECANELYESGDFAESVPDLCGLGEINSEDTNNVDLTNITDNRREICDLQGRRVSTPQKNGLYIKNGKKFIAR